MAHNYWEVPKRYILVSTGEGGYLYHADNSVQDFTMGQQQQQQQQQEQQLNEGTQLHWNSFYDFMGRYLTDAEDA